MVTPHVCLGLGNTCLALRHLEFPFLSLNAGLRVFGLGFVLILPVLQEGHAGIDGCRIGYVRLLQGES